VKKKFKNALWKNLVMTTKKLTAVPDVDFDIFDYNHREHDLWVAINALRGLVRDGYIEDHAWRLNEVANLLELQLENS
jgi:hypothetical protein